MHPTVGLFFATPTQIEEGRKKEYRENLEKELKEIHESELWQAGAAVRKLRP